MQARIIKMLKSANSFLSGKEMGTNLGLSEEKIQDHIHGLEKLGYEIIQIPEGYRLMNTPDVLYPWEFAARESCIHYYDEVDSTMNIARIKARDKCPHFTVIIADRQKKGRGRLKRTWVSKTGGLYFTVVLRPDTTVSRAHLFNFGASLSLAKMLRRHYRLDARVKWPNDVYVGDKKISGLLSEMETENDHLAFVNIGIGINVNNNPTTEEPNATSLKILLGKAVPRKTVLLFFLDEFETMLDTHCSNAGDIIAQWKQFTMTIGKNVRIVTGRETAEGKAIDVDETGALILEAEDGSLKKIIYGDCFVI